MTDTATTATPSEGAVVWIEIPAVDVKECKVPIHLPTCPPSPPLAAVSQGQMPQLLTAALY